MKMLFHIYIPFAAPGHAGVQQSIRVSYYMAVVGVDVTVYMSSFYFKEKQDILGFFGLEDIENYTVKFFPHPIKNQNNIFMLKLWGVVFHVSRFLSLLLTHEKYNYDVFFSRGYKLQTLFVMFKRWLHFKVVFEMHEIYSVGCADIGTHDCMSEDRIYEDTHCLDSERFMFKNAHGIISITRTLKELAERKWGKREKITVIPSGTITFESDPLEINEAPTKIYYVGNFLPFSGLDDLVRAMKMIPNATLTVVGGKGLGDTNYERVYNVVCELTLEDRVRFVGFVQPTLLHEHYKNAEILVMPHTNFIRAKYFVSPLKLFEYMSARRPIVASDLPTIREVLQDEENALLARSEDSDDFAEKILRVINDKELALRIAEKAYLDVQQYSMQNKCSKIKQFCEGICNKILH